MRWPWQPAPGMVRIKERDLIELQRQALYVAELEERQRSATVQRAKLEAEVRLAARPEIERSAAAEIVEHPPLTEDGELHELAFDVAVDAAVWAQRERWLVDLGATGTKWGGTRG